MKLPPIYTVFCLVVLSLFTYAKYQGLAMFGSGNAAQSRGGSPGAVLGSHK